MKPQILVLIPSIGRPNMLDECFSALVTHSAGLSDYLMLSGGNSAIEAINAVPMSLIAQYPIIGIICDDVRMRTPRWDEMIVDKMGDQVGMVHGWDGIQNERIATHPFFSSAIPQALGYVMPPGLKHYYGDQFLKDLLDPLDRVSYITDLVAEHLHHSVGKSEHDATYSRSEQWIDGDRIAYEEYCANQLASDRKKIEVII